MPKHKKIRPLLGETVQHVVQRELNAAADVAARLNAQVPVVTTRRARRRYSFLTDAERALIAQSFERGDRAVQVAAVLNRDASTIYMHYARLRAQQAPAKRVSHSLGAAAGLTVLQAAAALRTRQAMLSREIQNLDAALAALTLAARLVAGERR